MVAHLTANQGLQFLGSNPAPPQYMANSVSPEVGSHLG
jgi:hypothetical protein